MEINKITNDSEHEVIASKIEELLKKSSSNGGFSSLTKEETLLLKNLSLLVEEYEDNQLHLMPIKAPKTLIEMIRFKMYEMNIKQKQLAKLLEMSEARISELLNGKRKLNLEIAKKLHRKLNIDAKFLLDVG
jgi:HTH-type transcriptional regulator / antitoxin HigA